MILNFVRCTSLLKYPELVGRRDNRDRQNERKEKVEEVREERKMDRENRELVKGKPLEIVSQHCTSF